MGNITSKGSCHQRPTEDKSVSKGFTARKDLQRNWQVPIFLTDCWHHTHSITPENLVESLIPQGLCRAGCAVHIWPLTSCLCREGQWSHGSLKPCDIEIQFPIPEPSCLIPSVGGWESVPIRATVAAEIAFILLLVSPPNKLVSACWLLKEMPIVTETFGWLWSAHSLKSKTERRKEK